MTVVTIEGSLGRELLKELIVAASPGLGVEQRSVSIGFCGVRQDEKYIPRHCARCTNYRGAAGHSNTLGFHGQTNGELASLPESDAGSSSVRWSA
jgi:hypothetical protein